MATKRIRTLKKGEIEVVWNSGQMELIQTDGMAYNSGGIVLEVSGHKLIIPMTSVRRFRVLAI